jgi:hypothetical protein
MIEKASKMSSRVASPRRPTVVGIVGDGDASFFTGAEQVPRADFGVSVELPLSVWLHVDADVTVIHLSLGLATAPDDRDAEHRLVTALLFLFLHANCIVWYAPSTRFDSTWLHLLQRVHAELIRLRNDPAPAPTNASTATLLRQRAATFQSPILTLVVNVPRSILAPGQDVLRLLQLSVDQRMRQVWAALRLTPPVSSRQVATHPSFPNTLPPLALYDTTNPSDTASGALSTPSMRGRVSQHRQPPPVQSSSVAPWLFHTAGSGSPASVASFVTVRLTVPSSSIQADSYQLLAPAIASKLPSSPQLKEWSDALTSLPLAFSSLWLDLPIPIDASILSTSHTMAPLSSSPTAVWARFPRDIIGHWPAISPSIPASTSAATTLSSGVPASTACHAWWVDGSRVLQGCFAALAPLTPRPTLRLMSLTASPDSESNVSAPSSVSSCDQATRCTAVTWAGWPCEALVEPVRVHQHRSIRSADWVGCACGQSSILMPDLWVDETHGHARGKYVFDAVCLLACLLALLPACLAARLLACSFV